MAAGANPSHQHPVEDAFDFSGSGAGLPAGALGTAVLTATGTKSDGGKPALTLLPLAGLESAARAFMHGRRKYGLNNWRGGMTQRRVIDAALRHIYAHLEGEDLDEEGLEHLGCAIAELMMATHYMRHRPDLDDRVSETQR